METEGGSEISWDQLEQISVPTLKSKESYRERCLTGCGFSAETMTLPGESRTDPAQRVKGRACFQPASSCFIISQRPMSSVRRGGVFLKLFSEKSALESSWTPASTSFPGFLRRSIAINFEISDLWHLGGNRNCHAPKLPSVSS